MTIVHSQILTSAGSDASSGADALLDKERASLPPKTRRRMARERRGAESSLVSMETPCYKTIY